MTDNKNAAQILPVVEETDLEDLDVEAIDGEEVELEDVDLEKMEAIPKPKAAPRRKRARKPARKPARAAKKPVEIDGMKTDVASMQRHWKRIHEISGAIVASLEAFETEMKARPKK